MIERGEGQVLPRRQVCLPMRCPSCGASLPAEELECARCGAQVGWWVKARTGEVHGPYTFLEMQPMIRKGQLGPLDRVRVGLLGEWVPAPEVLRPGFGEAQAQARPRPKARRRPTVSWHAIVAGLLAVGAIVGGAYWLYRSQLPEPPDLQRVCAGNLRLLARGMRMYVADHAHPFPKWVAWTAPLREYVTNDEVFRCPAAGGAEPGYDFNAALGGLRWGEVIRPQECAMFWDAGALGPTAAVPGGHTRARHGEGDNFAYVDGHVEWRERTAYTNVTPLLQPK